MLDYTHSIKYEYTHILIALSKFRILKMCIEEYFTLFNEK